MACVKPKSKKYILKCVFETGIKYNDKFKTFVLDVEKFKLIKK